MDEQACVVGARGWRVRVGEPVGPAGEHMDDRRVWSWHESVQGMEWHRADGQRGHRTCSSDPWLVGT